MTTDTTCIIPWNSLVVRPTGMVIPCCHAEGFVGSLYESTLDELWNGDKMRTMREGLARGEQIPACKACWDHENAGVRSMRQFFNENMKISDASITMQQVRETGPRTGWRAEIPPDNYVLQLGNLCNLKCRSCHEYSSSRIASDQVHRAWSLGRVTPAWKEDRLELAPILEPGADYEGLTAVAGGVALAGAGAIELSGLGSELRALRLRFSGAGTLRVRLIAEGATVVDTPRSGSADVVEIPVETSKLDHLRLVFDASAPLTLEQVVLVRAHERRRLKIVPEGKSPWYKHIDAIVESVQKTPRPIYLYLLGGEPLMIDEVWELCAELVARKLSQRIILGISTNGTMKRDDLAKLTPSFHHVVVQVSIDGYQKMFEYLRHGAKWDELLEVLRWFRTLPNTGVVVIPTVQNYNALDAPRLFRLLDSMLIPFAYNLLWRPPRLSIRNLPPTVRRAAAASFERYATEARHAQGARVARLYRDVLTSAGDAFDPVLFREFMLFTNDLDVTRGERFADADPELAALIAEAGIEWIPDLHHAR